MCGEARLSVVSELIKWLRWAPGSPPSPYATCAMRKTFASYGDDSGCYTVVSNLLLGLQEDSKEEMGGGVAWECRSI